MASSKPIRASKPSAATVASKTLAEIVWNPFVYMPYTAVALGNAVVPVPFWMNIPAVLGITAGHIWYWKRNWNFLYRKHELAEEVKYRRAQNLEIREPLGGDLLSKVRASYLFAIGDALKAKEEIEAKVFSDGLVSSRERDILETVEMTVRQMIQVMNKTEEGPPPAEFEDALATLLELNKDFQNIARPVFISEEENQSSLKNGLAESTQALKNRMEEANRIRAIATETREKIH